MVAELSFPKLNRVYLVAPAAGFLTPRIVPAVSDVNAPVVPAIVLGVVAPTVPLMLIDAVPVKFVTTPEAGVPSAGAVITGLVRVLFVSVWVLVAVVMLLGVMIEESVAMC